VGKEGPNKLRILRRWFFARAFANRSTPSLADNDALPIEEKYDHQKTRKRGKRKDEELIGGVSEAGKEEDLLRRGIPIGSRAERSYWRATQIPLHPRNYLQQMKRTSGMGLEIAPTTSNKQRGKEKQQEEKEENDENMGMRMGRHERGRGRRGWRFLGRPQRAG